MIDHEEILNIVRREVARVLGTRSSTRMGIVEAYDPNTHAAKVSYPPDKTLSGWLAVGSVRIGQSAGMHFAPNEGDQVLVHFMGDNADSGVIGLRYYSDQDRPLSVPAGQTWFIDDAGAGFKFPNDGTGQVITVGNMNFTVGADCDFAVTGTANIIATHINLGGMGGKAIALVGDSVSAGIITGPGSTTTKAV